VNFVSQTGCQTSEEQGGEGRREYLLALAPSQLAFIEGERGARSSGAFAGAVVRACMLADSSAVFGIVRCKTATIARGPVTAPPY
jgi:hypothetical protein